MGHGHGKITQCRASMVVCLAEGELTNEISFATQNHWPDGQVYVGEWEDHSRNGRGKKRN
jgi:hypothetical protein